jgi:Homeodomain-like domain
MSNDDVLFGFRLRVFALAAEIGVRPACRAMGVHHSTYYRWKRRVDRRGLEALMVRSGAGRGCRTSSGRTWSSASSPSRLPSPAWARGGSPPSLPASGGAGLRISANGVWRVLCRHGLNTRSRRLGLVAGYAARYERRPPAPEPERHVEASRPGELVGVDCFYVGRLSGTKAQSGSTPRLMSPPASPGPSSTPRHAIPASTAARSSNGSPPSSPAPAGGWKRSSPITAPSFAPDTSMTG